MDLCVINKQKVSEALIFSVWLPSRSHPSHGIGRHCSTIKVPDESLSDAGVEPMVVTTPAKSGNVEQDGGTPAVAVVNEAAENTSKPEGEEELAVNVVKLDQHISSNFEDMKKIARMQAFHL
ncbi:unnamed protein product [Orchesella dallaii]|uniref:Uncharacterized protein n=1 Tax=Orchesella dallaii TaxID=48710 RepID=A0ABP1RH36_9HEXA